MNIDELLQSLPSREDIARAVGGQSRSTTTDLLPALGIFGTGMLFGAGLALLFAPKSGSEIRQGLSEKVQEYGQQAREMVEGTGLGEYVGAGSGQHSGQRSSASASMPGEHSSGEGGIPGQHLSGQPGSPGQMGGSHVGGSSGGRNV